MARQTLEKSIKFKGLIQALGIPRPCVRGLLETMWDVAHECGNPKLGTPRQVELAAEWYGEPGIFFAALKDLEWIDEIEDSPGRWEIHDYWDHAPKSAAGRAQREAEREMKGTTLSELRREAGRLGGLAKAGKSVATASNLPEDLSNRKQTPSKSAHSRHPTPDTEVGVTPSEASLVFPEVEELREIVHPPEAANGRAPVNGHSKTRTYPPDFLAWYGPYPRHEAKEDAHKAWKQTANIRPPTEEMLETLEWQKRSEGWRKNNGQFIPLPASYLRAGRWSDSPKIEGVQLLPLEPPRAAPSPPGRFYQKL